MWIPGRNAWGKSSTSVSKWRSHALWGLAGYGFWGLENFLEELIQRRLYHSWHLSNLHKWKREGLGGRKKKKERGKFASLQKRTLLLGPLISYTSCLSLSQDKHLKHSLMGKHLDDGITMKTSSVSEEQHLKLSSSLHTRIHVHLEPHPFLPNKLLWWKHTRCKRAQEKPQGKDANVDVDRSDDR